MGIIRVWKILIRQMILFTIVFPCFPQISTSIFYVFPCITLFFSMFYHSYLDFPTKNPHGNHPNVIHQRRFCRWCQTNAKDTKNAFQGAPALSILAARRMYEQFLLRLLFCLVGFSWQKIEKHWLLFCSRVIMVGWWKLATNMRTMMIRKHWEKIGV